MYLSGSSDPFDSPLQSLKLCCSQDSWVIFAFQDEDKDIGLGLQQALVSPLSGRIHIRCSKEPRGDKPPSPPARNGNQTYETPVCVKRSVRKFLHLIKPIKDCEMPQRANSPLGSQIPIAYKYLAYNLRIQKRGSRERVRLSVRHTFWLWALKPAYILPPSQCKRERQLTFSTL